MRFTFLKGWCFVLLSQACVAQIPQSAVSISLRADTATYKTLGEAVLEVSVTNRTDNTISTDTMADPPVFLNIVDENGKAVVHTTQVKKTPHSRSVRFKLEPNQTRVYKKAARDFLGIGQKMAEATTGVVKITAVLNLAQFQGGKYEFTSIESKPITITVVP